MGNQKKGRLSQNNIDFLKSLQKTMIQEKASGTYNWRSSIKTWVIKAYIPIPRKVYGQLDRSYKRSWDVSGEIHMWEIYHNDYERMINEEEIDDLIAQSIDEYTIQDILQEYLENDHRIDFNVKKWPLLEKVVLLKDLGHSFQLFPYGRLETINKDAGFFLTQKAAQQYLDQNRHRYDKKAYGATMTAEIQRYSVDSNPQLRQLVEILETTNWELYEEKKKRKAKIDDKNGRLSQKNIDFLKNLQNQMAKEDAFAKNSIRMWVIIDYARRGATGKYADGFEIYYDGLEVLTEDELDSIIKYDLSWHEDFRSGDKHSIDKKIQEYSDRDLGIPLTLKSPQLKSFAIKAHLIKDYVGNIEIYPYLDTRIIKNAVSHGPGFFLTKEAAQQHIYAERTRVSDGAYYERAYAYCLPGWGNPQMRQLVELIERTDWEIYEEKAKEE